LTSIADTRLLITLQFPPNQEIKQKTKTFIEKELKDGLLISTIVLAEFASGVKVAVPVPDVNVHVPTPTLGMALRKASRPQLFPPVPGLATGC